MNMTVGVGGAGLLFGGLYLSGALSGGEVYPKPYETVRSELASMPIPEQLRDGMASIPGTDVQVEQKDGEISWTFATGGHKLAKFAAQLSEEGPQATRVIVSFEPGADMPEGQIRKLASIDLVRKGAEIAMAEQIDSRLEGRPYDKMRVNEAFATYTVMNPGAAMQYGREMERSIREIENVSTSQEAQRYGEIARSQMNIPPNPRDATRPTTDLSEY